MEHSKREIVVDDTVCGRKCVSEENIGEGYDDFMRVYLTEYERLLTLGVTV